jgi:N6-L-threonylcarbamoyladenine synthase
MIVLGIETSCDETAASVVEDGIKILSNPVASQVDIHARYGGVVPEVASRQHILAMIPILRQAMTEAQVDWKDLDGIAVTIGPGLAGSLLVGANVAKAITLAHGLPLTGINHLEGHIYANWLVEHAPNSAPTFPLLCLVVSGGHSDLVLMKGHGNYILLGRTRDDAAGEAFDKAARILGLGYPGGPAIERAARSGIPSLNLPRAWLKGTNDFSFSGVKTALLRLVTSGSITSRCRRQFSGNGSGCPDNQDNSRRQGVSSTANYARRWRGIELSTPRAPTHRFTYPSAYSTTRVMYR